ncbi:hypothetical protein DPMN_139966 [Dreissena polymorpha]|uniref:Uncharacterized protein n=1 Tax=Dreissena polymorpha TaxID=45954 RepID=A0A9D4FUQ1_DREPO|nr:hypothetical protein DPMN_132241 [Dreissena polymorpha]KAH3811556.1 hypothetical protein DPMN_139966 [Dreissena polymorpha]
MHYPKPENQTCTHNEQQNGSMKLCKPLHKRKQRSYYGDTVNNATSYTHVAISINIDANFFLSFGRNLQLFTYGENLEPVFNIRQLSK